MCRCVCMCVHKCRILLKRISVYVCVCLCVGGCVISRGLENINFLKNSCFIFLNKYLPRLRAETRGIYREHGYLPWCQRRALDLSCFEKYNFSKISCFIFLNKYLPRLRAETRGICVCVCVCVYVFID